MSSDGVQQPDWYGKTAFPHLLHGPNFQRNAPSHNYGELRKSPAQGQPRAPAGLGSDVHTPAGTGTWNGPAPRGGGAQQEARLEAARQEHREKANVSAAEPQAVYVAGADMPVMGLRTNKVKSEQEIEAAIGAGYRLFECAPSYGNEATVGKGLRACERRELFVVSNLPNDCHAPAAVRAACEKSLADLGCGHLDLYLMQWPVAWQPGTQAPDGSVTLQDTWAAMEKLVEDGLAKAIGVANFGVVQVEEILAGCRIKPAVNVVELHPLLAERKMVGVLFRKGVQCVAACPLAGRSPELLEAPAVAELAGEVGRSPAEVLLKWNAQRGVPVLPSLQGPGDLLDLNRFFSWKFTNQQKTKLDNLDQHKRFLTVDWHSFDDPEKGGAVKASAVLL